MFAHADEVPALLKKIYAAAGAHDLELETGEYSRIQTADERLVRYRVSFPVKGSFQQVFLFMDKVLRENNTVALENVAFKRDKVDDAVVEAKLVFLIIVDSKP
jgi:Tfp pilus assembly protein PilO